MRLNRFVVPTKADPNTKRVDLSDGDFIVIKKRLSTGEAKTIEASNLRTLYNERGPNGLPKVAVDLEGFALVRVYTWLTEWSFRNADDQPVPLTIEAVSALDRETFDEIENAISAHLDAVAAEKKRAATLAMTDSPTANAAT